ncbi:conserved exported hypothetical protein [Hyphomicrobiales bacterium]|nr:conserved exported hypothetical protein [Hyphomicrobiales bacterium]CAH1689485.1 conserved exported hypothetical protein [Hyphomicrobiales bacterium]
MKRRWKTAVALTSVALTVPAVAQEASPEQPIQLEAIVVNAQRREQLAKDVPVSLRVFSRKELEERIVKRLDDAFAATPNASMTSQRGGNDASTLSIRGVTTTAFGADPSVGVYVDDVYVGNDNGFNTRMSDFEQIEILRGPQGTLYGRNAIGGAVNIRTENPELGVNKTRLQAGAGSDGLLFGTATTNLAIGENAAARIAIFGDRSDGWLRNAQGGPDLMNLNDFGGRAKLLARPTDNWQLELSVDYAKDQGRRNGYGPFATVWKFGVDQAVPNLDHTENYGSSLKSTWTLDFGQVTSVTAWRGARAEGGGGNFTPLPLQNGGYERDYNQFTQELRANGETALVNWTVGAFFLSSSEKRYEYAGFYPALPANMLFPGQPSLPASYQEGTHSDVDSLTAALFADTTWHLTNRLDLIAGARVSYDRKSIDYRHGSSLGAMALFAPALQTSQTADGIDVSPRAGLSFAVNDDIRIYGTVSRGYKPKGFNISFAPDADIGYKAESAINYEVGLKGTAAGGRVGYALSAFYFDWHNQQVYSFNDNRLTIANAPKSRSYGAEAEVSAEVLEGLRLYAGAGYLNAKFTDYPNAMSGQDESGNQQPFASRYSLNLSAQYTKPLQDGINFVARADYNWKSAFFWDTANTIREPAYGVVNARVGFETDDWGVSLYAQNILDQEYRVRAATYSGQAMAIPGTPQTFGVLARATF